MIVVIDNTQKQKAKMFLPKLLEYLDNSKIAYSIIKGDTTGLINLKNIPLDTIDGVIMSGSPIMLNEKSIVDEFICNLYCLKYFKDTPILGICFGCQLINMYFGGSLYDMGSLHCETYHVQSNAFESITKSGLNAKFCCRYIPDCVPSKVFEVLMLVDIREKNSYRQFPCLIKHKKRLVTGVMFHPEALKKTYFILDEFLSHTKNIK
jgi:anthranilate/para-aminobenzoate synthase component II